MNEEEQNFDTNEYEQESFDNESSEDVSSDEESISEESSFGESLDEMLPHNSSIKNVPGSIDDNRTFEQKFNDVSSVSSENGDETPEILSNNENFEAKNDAKTKIYSDETNSHEIDESESDDLPEEDLTDNVKSLTIQNEERSLEVVVPTENSNLEAENETEITNDDAQVSSCQQSEIEFIVTSQTPTSFNSENYDLHMEILQKPTRSNTSLQQQRNKNRKNLSFSNERMREIERHNQILLRKILTQKPRKNFINQKIPSPSPRMTTSAVNRKKQQRQIDLDNQVLKRKIEAVALRRPQML